MSRPSIHSRDPALQEAITLRPVPDILFDPQYREARKKHLDGVRHLLPAPQPIEGVLEQELLIPARDGYQVRTVTYRTCPASHNEKSEGLAAQGPLIVLFHEGGWAMGDASDEESNARLFAKELGAVCLVPEYRLAPEHPFPMGVLDCWDVLKWATENFGEIHADPTRGFVVGGSSAGANIAAVLIHQARKEKLSPRLTGQWLSAAYLLPPELVPEEYKYMYTSMWENTVDPVLPPLLKGPDGKTEGFITDMVRADVTSPLFSPFSQEWYNTTAEEQTPIPKAFFQVGGLDPLRDHSLIYQQVLENAWGTKTKLVQYDGFGHMYWANWPQLQRSQDYWRDMMSGMRWLLDKEE
ncbi:hypothetical protein NW762_010947 [Fusarium torreyae]|uniref:Alpha/beta hydrolase fold-3 domain-containing protein n=1 Tax=Fusarium torreyae TaxID=1237075 RepID=A0A9W8RU15_9HYPO|nr:hypothetical protein NW762_010947 [Fusarium torreyae]